MYINNDYNYSESVKSLSRKWTLYRLVYYNDGVWTTIPDARKYIKSFTLSDYSSDGSNITMGAVSGGKMVLSFKSVPSNFVGYFKEGTQITAYFDLKGNPSDVYSSTLITFSCVIDNVKISKRTTGQSLVVTAYDLSYVMTHEYITSLQNPTALEIVTEIAQKYNLSVDDSVSLKIQELDPELLNMTFAPLSGFTCKETLGYIAGCFGCNARVTLGRKIAFEWFELSTSLHIENESIYLDGLTASQNIVVKLIETGTKENPIVYPENAAGVSINFENPYITADLAKRIYDNKIADDKISFKTGKVKYKGNPINMSGKIVVIPDVDGSLFNFYIMKRTLNYDGGLSETIECFGESETTISFKITSPTQQKIDRALSKMEEAIKKATDIITQTKGSVFELIPIDENDPTKGNSGWKLYSTEIGSNNLILANSSGIGFSSNGGQSFNAMALYIDENGIGHINANCIDVGKLSADIIDTSTLIVSKENVDGLDTELAELLEVANEADKKAGNAETTANTASSTANTASTNASSALSVANSANGKIANWASANDTTLIDGAKIYTGSITAKQIASESITADKLAVGAITADKIAVGDLTNYIKVNAISYKAFGFDTIESFYPNTSIPTAVDWAWLTPVEYKTQYYLGDWVDFSYNKEGDNKFLYQGQFYNTRSNTYAYFCVNVMLDNGVTYVFNQGTGTGDVYCYGSGFHSFSKTIALGTSYGGHRVIKIRPMIYFSTAPTATYWFAINEVTFRRATAGDITAGKLQSVDGLTYFDLDNSLVETADLSGYKTRLSVGGLENYYGESEVGGLRSVYANLGTGSAYELLYFTDPKKHPLLIAADKDNPDPYMDFIYDETFRDNCINVYKQINVTNAFFTSCRNIQSGIITGVTSSGSSVIFSKSFMRTPRVICTPIQSRSENDVGVTTVLTDVSYDGFTVRTNNVSGDWSFGSDVQWIAIDIP